MTHPPLLGIVGGYGPKTSAEFCIKLVRYAQKYCDTHGPGFAMDSVPIDMAVAGRCIAGDTSALRELLPGINAAILRLHAQGVRTIAVPCNSVHGLFSEFIQPEGTELVHIADPLLRRLQSRGTKTIGFLSTSMTIQSDIYTSRIRGAGVRMILPSSAQQERLDRAIGLYVQNGKASEEARRLLQEILAGLPAQGAECVVLACTDLSGMMAACALHPPLPTEDSLDTLAEECAQRSISLI